MQLQGYRRIVGKAKKMIDHIKSSGNASLALLADTQVVNLSPSSKTGNVAIYLYGRAVFLCPQAHLLWLCALHLLSCVPL